MSAPHPTDEAAAREVTAAHDGSNLLRCTTPTGEVVVELAPRGEGPAYERTRHFTVRYRAAPGSPPVDARLLAAIVRALRASEDRLVAPAP